MDQIVSSMSPVQKFWYDRLSEGCLRKDQDGWTEKVETEDLYNDYIEFAGKLVVASC
jgi:hypothetical protein